MKPYLFLLIILFLVEVNAQTRYSSLDELNSIIISVEDSTDFLKIDKIYSYITNNIVYDVKKYKKSLKIAEINIKRKRKKLPPIVLDLDTPLQTVNDRKGICSEYAELFKVLCDLNDIKCYTQTGYAKFRHETIGRKLIVNHAWNVVILEDTARYIDCTWGAGYLEIKNEDTKKEKMNFVHHSNRYYFLQYDSIFQFSHLASPYLLDTNFNKKLKNFEQLPYISSGFYENKIYDFKPKDCTIEMKLNDTLQVHLNSTKNIQFADFSIEDVYKKRIYETQHNTRIDLKKIDDKYSFDYVFQPILYNNKLVKNYSIYLHVFIDNKYVMTYKVIIKS